MALGTPLEHGALPGRPRDVEAGSKDLPFLTFLGAPGRSKGTFWTPGGSRKGSKIDMARLGRHLGGQEGPKSSSKGGARNGTEKVTENGSQNESFWEVKNLQKYCKVLQNRGFEGRGKVSKKQQKMSSKRDSKIIFFGDLNGPRAAKGRLCHPPWSILRGPKNGSIFEGSLGRKKVDGC